MPIPTMILAIAGCGGTGTCTVLSDTGINAVDIVVDPANASCTLGVSFASGWTATAGGGGAVASPATCPGANFEVELVLVGDNPTSGDTYGSATWNDLSTPRSWTWAQSTVGTLSGTFTLTE